MVDLPDYYTAVQLTLAEVSAIVGGPDAAKSADPNVKDCYLATDTEILYVCFTDGVWTNIGILYLPLAGGTMAGAIAMGANKITGLADPTLAQDAATRAYVLARCGLYLPLTGGAMAGNIAMGGNKITGLGAPTNANDAVRKAYADLFALLTTFNDHSARHENGGADELSVAGLSGLLADDQHVLDAEVTAVAVAKTTLNANSILYAILDDTPIALAVAASRIVGRKAAGDISAMTGAEVMAILTGQAAADFSMNTHKITDLAAPANANDAVRKAYADLFTLLTTFNDHKDRHDPIDGADKLDTAIPVKVGAANAIGSSHSLSRADHVHEREHAIYTHPQPPPCRAATSAQTGHATAAQITKLDGIATGADVTGANAPQAHKDSHDPIDGGDKLDTAAPVKVGAANAIGSSHSLSRADHVHEREHAKYTDAEAVDAIEADGNLPVASITCVIDGGGATIATGWKMDLEIPFACTINRVTLLATPTGSIVIDIWKATYANFPSTGADSITASARPTISSGVKAQDSTLTGWTTAIAAGDTLSFNVVSVTDIRNVTLSLKVTKT